MEKMSEANSTCGAKLLLDCNARWCDEQIMAWGIMEYPDLEAVQNATSELERINWFRYVDSQTFLGLPIQVADRADFDAPAAVYNLAIIRNVSTESMAIIPENDRARLLEEVSRSLESHGGKTLITCDIDWSNSESTMFLAQSFPSFEALQAHTRDFSKLGLNRYVNARVILGTKMQ
jgi:hypothetical protein